MTPVKCFRVLAGGDGAAAIYAEDWAGFKSLYWVTMNQDATYWARKALGEMHKVPVLDWDEEYKA